MISRRNDKYYLGFFYPTSLRIGMHCTHAYFGTMSVRSAEEIVKMVDSYFRIHGPIGMPKVLFDQEEFFDDGKCRVLTTRSMGAFQILQPLRDSFAALNMISTKYPFRPHVTTPDLHTIDQHFACYALMRSGIIQKGWTLSKMGRPKPLTIGGRKWYPS